MASYRNYWVYSIGCFVVWAVLLAVVAATRARTRHNVVLVFAAWVIAWVSTTIARYDYPPPTRWLKRRRLRPDNRRARTWPRPDGEASLLSSPARPLS